MTMTGHDLEALHPSLARELPGIVDRVADRFPAASRELVEAVVSREGRRLHEKPVHDFLTILVERAACDVLRSSLN